MKGIRTYIFQDRISYGFRPSIFSFVRLFFGPTRSKILFQYRYLNFRFSPGYVTSGDKFIYNILAVFLKRLYQHNCERLNVDLPINTTIGNGVVLPHGFPLVINPMAKIGKNCIIHPCVLIGRDRGKEGAPTIGDNCFIGHGAKIIGNLVIGNWCFISPAAVVTKDIPDGSLVGAGVNNILSNEGKKHVVLYNRIK